MRSHNEEKPFQCKWPGCGKGFARAHDCKRHEQLHFNYRPHKCEGCGKSFQRMDALNRHRKCSVRSTQPILIDPSQYAQREGKTVSRLRTRLKPMARLILLGSTLEIRWHLTIQTLAVALLRWTSVISTTVVLSKQSPTVGGAAS